MKKLYLVLICTFLLTGCKANLMKQSEILSETIINLMDDNNYSIKKLSKENQKIITSFLKKESYENKIINITELDVFNEEGRDIRQEDTEGIYSYNNTYYIKYKDLDFKTDNSNDPIASLYINGYIVSIDKSSFPLFYYDTHDDINYSYRYMKREKKENEINYYYRSYGNGSMLTINYEIKKNQITNINLIYNSYYTEK